MRNRYSTRFLLAILGALVLGAGTSLVAEATAPYEVVEVVADLEIKEEPGAKVPEYRGPIPAAPYAAKGMALFAESEPNDTTATANALAGSEAVVYGTIVPAADVDYFSFTANAGDRVSAATMTQFSNSGSTDTDVSIIASDGTTVLENDNDSGSFSSLSSAISGTVIPAAGTYYIWVDGRSTTTPITPYHLHVRVLSGTPTAEVEPNNDTLTATPIAASGWMSGTMTATTDPDLFSIALNAGDSVFIALDMDPDRDPTNTNWNGRVGLGLFGDAGNQILVANDGSTTKPHAEAFFYTVKEAGTYYPYVDSTSSTGLGANARYHLSVRVIPKEVQTDCTVIASSDVPKILGPDVGLVTTSVITVPPTVTSSISDVNVLLDLTHALMADLDLTLTAPGGTSTPLFTDVGSTAVGGQVLMDLWLDEQAALPIGTFTVTKGMANQPEQPGRLSNFGGQPAGGTWTLTLTDDANATSGGTLNGWSLEVCGDPPPAFGLALTKTVGLDPVVCGASSSITVPPGATVYYCYTVTNIGLNDLVTHDLVDDQLGALLTGFPYSLAPGASVYFIAPPVVVNASVTNTATWTGYGSTGGSASDAASATVTVPTHCPAGYADVTLASSDFSGAFPPAGWTVANTSAGCTPPGVPEWTTTDPGLRGNLTGGSGLFAIADSDRCGSGSTLDTTLTTPAFDLTGLTDPRVYFHADYNDIATGGDLGLLEVSIDGGGTWSPALTWDEDHRGPLFAEQAIPGAGINGVQVRWHYAQGTYDWWWQVDTAMVTACQQQAPSISLVKTVGTTPGVCAATTSISVAAGTTVYYCYTVSNTGTVTLNLHDLSDDVLGTIFSGLSYALTPGSSVNTVAAGVSIPYVVNSTTTNTGTWTAYNAGPVDVAVATAEATVTVVTPPDIDVSPSSLASTQPGNVTTQQALTIGNTGGSDLIWNIFEEPAMRVPPVAVPPVETLNPEVDLEAELTGVDSATPAVTVRDPAAAARARSMLQLTGLLLIPDSTADRVMAFDPITGNLVDADFIPADPTNLSTPKSAILSAAGDSVLVADQVDDVVQEYDLDGNYLGVFAPAGGVNNAILDNILGIDLRPNDNLLVPVDSGANQDSVAEFDTGGVYLGNFIAIGAGGLDSGFDVFPLGSDWLVTSINTDNLLRYDSTGAPLGVFAPAVSFGEQINGAANGNVLVANFSTPNSGVMEFTPAGALVGVYAAVTGNRGVYELPNGNILTTNGSGVHEIDRLGNLVATKYAVTGAQYIEFAAPTAGCTNPADVPWLSEVPTNGTTAAGGSTPVQVTFDSTGLADGTYSAALCVASNDPDAGPGNGTDLVVVPVTLDVESLVPAIDLVKTVGTTPGVCAATTTITVAPGTTVYYCYEVTNTGNVTLNLHDLADDQVGTIFSGLNYALTPGSSVNTVAAGLNISAVITAPTTNVGTWTAYNAGPVDQAVATATATVNLTDPDITVNPTSLLSAQMANQLVTLPLDLGNVGGSDLTWTLEEEPAESNFPPMPTAAGPGDAAAADERFDEQPPATVPDEVPAPVVWFGPDAVLYDNGPLVTHPGGGAGGADASVLQTNLGMNTLGAGAQVAAGNRVADEFTVTDPSGWDIDTITFFTYQTGSTTTSTINAVNVRIWNGAPNAGGTVVWGDTTTNLLTGTTWANMYRVTDTTLTTTNRPVMTAVAAVNTVLPPGTYWVDYQIGGTLASGPWIPPVTILGQTTTGNALQFTSTGWAALTDSGTLTPQGVPFIIEGQPAICGNLADVPWLSANPTAGTIAASGNQTVNVTFDSTGIALGTYQATICVFSNDPIEPVVPVPVTMDVVIPVELQSFTIE